MDDTDVYLNLAMSLWEEEQAGGDYLWDINLLPLPKEELNSLHKFISQSNINY